MAAAVERQPGEILDGRYRLVSRLGRGGFGDVWRAEEILPDGKPLREVALKLLVQGIAEDWAEEARIIASLRHPALVTIYAAGLLHAPEGDTPFVAMELLRGENLAVHVDRGQRVAWRRVLRWAREVAAALDEIHRAGVVHLDLKPANLFLTESGVKVLDFGIARQGSARAVAATGSDDGLSTVAFMALGGAVASTGVLGGHTSSRAVVGTPGFMAPEVIEGGEPTSAADAYALAACLVQLATGALPQDVRARPGADAPTTMADWLADVQSATLHGRLRDLDGAGLPRAVAALACRWLRLDPMARAVPVGSLRAQLDEVWHRPHGLPERPFRGLEPFGAEHEGHLHGRDGEIDRLATDLVHLPGLVLQGPPCSGLTSLALAGVAPALARSGADEREDFVTCHVKLDSDPVEALESAYRRLASLEPPSAASPGDGASGGGAEAEGPTTGGPGVIERIEAWAGEGRLGAVLVLEDVAAWLDHPGAGSLAASVLQSFARRAPGLRWIGLVHEERLAELLAVEAGRGLQPLVRYVGPPSASVVEDLVLGPARSAGRAVVDATAVLSEIKTELGRSRSGLGTVALALARWWEGALDGARWRQQGGLVGPLADHAEATWSALAVEERALADRLLLRMVRANGRILEVEWGEVVDVERDPAASGAVLTRLLRARVVAWSGGKLSLAHPALVHRWARLHDRRLHDVDRMSFLEELREAALRWRQVGMPRSELWSGAKLSELDGRFAAALEELRAEERAFVEASRDGHRRTLATRALAVVLLLAVLVATVWSDAARRREAEEQTAQVQRATRAAAVEKLVTASRRTNDPYRRIALLGAALSSGSSDPILPLDLYASTRGLPAATFLTLDPPNAPRFPWDDRFILGSTRSHVVILDVLAADGLGGGTFETRLAAHEEGVLDVEPFRFAHGFVSRGLDGSLRVWRVRSDRTLGFAAESPMRCTTGLSRVLVAEAAPVVACATADGIARWDLREPAKVDTAPAAGRLLAIDPRGEWLAVARQRKLLVWPAGKAPYEVELPAEHSAMLGTFSGREPVLAVVDATHVALFAVSQDRAVPLFEGSRLQHSVTEPTSARFASSGVDLEVCDSERTGRWLYLRRGGRAESDGVAPVASDACRLDPKGPAALLKLADYGAPLVEAPSVGPRRFEGGFRLEDGRRLTRDLVSFDPRPGNLAAVTRASAVGRERDRDGVVAVVRAGDSVVWQLGTELFAEAQDGTERWRRAGNLLGACDDGRVLAWRRASEDRWEVFEAATDTLVRRIVRNPGFVLGMEPSCRRLFLQRLDGRLDEVALVGVADSIVEPKEIDPGGGGYAVDGYVFDVRPSAGGAGVEPGLWLAFGSGAMARADASGTLRSYGHARPRPTAMADGRFPGQLAFADETGVALRAPGEQDRRVVAPTGDREWSDLRVLPGGARGLVAWDGGLALVDLERGETLGWVEVDDKERLAPWDDEGSMLVWSAALVGPAQADVIPLGTKLARRVASLASNVAAELDPRGAIHVILR